MEHNAGNFTVFYNMSGGSTNSSREWQHNARRERERRQQQQQQRSRATTGTAATATDKKIIPPNKSSGENSSSSERKNNNNNNRRLTQNSDTRSASSERAGAVGARRAAATGGSGGGRRGGSGSSSRSVPAGAGGTSSSSGSRRSRNFGGYINPQGIDPSNDSQSSSNLSNNSYLIGRVDDLDFYDGDDDDSMSCCEVLRTEAPQLKWRVLFLSFFVIVGLYFCYDIPGIVGTGPTNTIQTKFKEAGKKYDQTMNLALFSVYSWPQCVLAIFGGVLISKVLGLRKSLIVFSLFVTAGQAVFYLGVMFTSYYTMLVGRFLVGVGGESLCVAQTTMITRWFSGPIRGLSLSFTAAIAVARGANGLSFFVQPYISKNYGVDYVLMIGLGVCGLATLSVLALCLLDWRAEKRGIIAPEMLPERGGHGQHQNGEGGGENGGGSGSSSARRGNCCTRYAPFRRLPLPLWIIFFITMFAYSAIFGFTNIAKNFFQRKFCYESIEAGRMVFYYAAVPAAGLPLAGCMIDNYGRRVYFLSLSIAVLLVGLLSLTLLPPDINAAVPAVLMGTLGAAYSVMVASLWTMVPFLVDLDVTGFAFGVMTAVQNFGLAVTPLLTGILLNDFQSSTSNQPPKADAMDRVYVCGDINTSDNGSFPDPPMVPAVPTAPTEPELQLSSWNTTTVLMSETGGRLGQDGVLPDLKGYQYSIWGLECFLVIAFALCLLLSVVDRRGRAAGILSASARGCRDFMGLKVAHEQSRHFTELIEQQTSNYMGVDQPPRNSNNNYNNHNNIAPRQSNNNFNMNSASRVPSNSENTALLKQTNTNQTPSLTATGASAAPAGGTVEESSSSSSFSSSERSGVAGTNSAPLLTTSRPEEPRTPGLNGSLMNSVGKTPDTKTSPGEREIDLSHLTPYERN